MAQRSDGYEIVSSAAINAACRKLLRKAVQLGKGKEFVRGARIIINKLQNEALTFGEPHFHLRHLELEIRIAIVSPLAICYGVHEKSRSVFIKEVKGLAGVGLDID
ncbi:MAG: hypothetical protein E6K70_14150 [Planctomycetota bacterium]|nr:MAG: hypothetical protein E6K70_14150 [Planctomycetota bacterium]